MGNRKLLEYIAPKQVGLRFHFRVSVIVEIVRTRFYRAGRGQNPWICVCNFNLSVIVPQILVLPVLAGI